MYYSIYKNVRNDAWNCLIDHGIDRLPVDVLKIARDCNIRVIKNCHVDILQPEEDAKAFFYEQKWYIIYNENNDVSVTRFAIAHELGHIFLGHDLTHAKYENVREFGKKSKAEQQSDIFATRLLCPACIIMNLGITSAEEISDTCRVPLKVARIRAHRMKELYKKNKFFSNDLEKAVFENFRDYVSQQTEK